MKKILMVLIILISFNSFAEELIKKYNELLRDNK